jgi:hypothetical protein
MQYWSVVGLRLVDGGSSMDGRLEVKLDNGTWGTVCDDNFYDEAAAVACRMLGHGATRAKAYSQAYFGKGSLPIVLDDVNCTGQEGSFYDCSKTFGSNCQHSEDVGVRCNPPGRHASLRAQNSAAAA